jgi:hypothetical protein
MLVCQRRGVCYGCEWAGVPVCQVAVGLSTSPGLAREGGIHGSIFVQGCQEWMVERVPLGQADWVDQCTEQVCGTSHWNL